MAVSLRFGGGSAAHGTRTGGKEKTPPGVNRATRAHVAGYATLFPGGKQVFGAPVPIAKTRRRVDVPGGVR